VGGRDMNNQKASNSLYPLNFVLRFVGKKQEELTAMETRTIKDVFELKQNCDIVYDFILNNTEADGSISAENVKKLQGYLNDGSNKLSDLNQVITERSSVFEDLGNILRQTGPLTNDLIMHDNLTSAYNRYFYLANGQKLYKRAKKKYGMSIAFIDIDNFRNFNTNYGHDFGDQVLKQISNSINLLICDYDHTYLIRVGGDEFIVINAGTIPYHEFKSLLERILKIISETPVIQRDTNKSASVTISIGAANDKNNNTECLLDLYRSADENVYISKERGRNLLMA
jgi:diguanylate cyclase (GGDEF)-like protein